MKRQAIQHDDPYAMLGFVPGTYAVTDPMDPASRLGTSIAVPFMPEETTRSFVSVNIGTLVLCLCSLRQAVEHGTMTWEQAAEGGLVGDDVLLLHGGCLCWMMCSWLRKA